MCWVASTAASPEMPGFRPMLVFQPRSVEDTRVREADPKRAHVRRFEPPGFLGVRGKKSSKSNDPVPGFLGVRGKKVPDNQINEQPISDIARYIQRELSKFT
ncbi:hypothetical protein CDAR_618941 [Caerostris darwini]|uniref:Uncharacterized protein n=1 Tax=Caerostris darwini TaxID=1538125 RepID=A0AAV4R135_9ARAC|nr:hypothetical protein CDAR_618941 [Caerostris darwini]